MTFKKTLFATLAVALTAGCYHVPVRTGDAALKTETQAGGIQDSLEWYAFWPYRIFQADGEAKPAAKPEAAAPSKAEAAASSQANALENLGGGIKVEKGAGGELSVTLPEEALQFKVGSAEVSEAGKAELAKFASAIKGFSGVKYTVLGYTDNKGDEGLNKALSAKRAEAVKQVLVAEGVAAAAFQAVEGKGAADPVADNASPEGRAKNRRVVVKLKN